MESSAHQEEQFIKWIMSKTVEIYWEFDKHGQRIKLKPGWEKAQKEFDRIAGKCFFWVNIMDRQITDKDIEFMRWLDGKEGEQYWDKDEKGEKVLLRSGWDNAKKEFDRIAEKGLKDKWENDFKV